MKGLNVPVSRWVATRPFKGHHLAFTVGCASLTAVLSASPALGGGDAFKWCVNTAGGASTCGGSSAGTACDNAVAFATVAEALAAAASAPDAAPGLRPTYQEICVSTPGLHTEDLSIVGGAIDFGPFLQIVFDRETAPTWCPSSLDASGVRLTGGGPEFTTTITNLWWDEALCLAAVGLPLISADGLSLRLNNVRTLGGTGTFFQHTGGGATWLEKVRVEGRLGAALVAVESISVLESEFSANSPPAGQSLISVAGGEIELWHSAVFGNVVGGGVPLMVSRGAMFRDALIGANIVVGNGPLLRVDRPVGGVGGRLSIRSTVISRNVLLETGSAEVGARPSGRIASPGHESRLCLPEAADNLQFRQRIVPEWKGKPARAPLFLLEGATAFSPLAIELFGSMVVQNVLGGEGTVVRSDTTGSGLEIHLLHNIFDLTGQSVVELVADSTADRLTSARNLVLGSTRPAILTGVARYELTMDVALAADELWPPALDPAAGIRGPFRSDSSLFAADALLGAPEIEALEDCERAQRLCPALVCPLTGLPPQELFCALDVGASYVSADFSGSSPWVWDSEFFEPRAAGDPYNAEGPVGWVCEGRASPFDRRGEAGDGDGYTTLLDCDNEDPTVVPRLPGEDGVSSLRCWDLADDCYVCPPGSELVDPPLADDDDSGLPGDDDSATIDPDESGSDPTLVAPGCVRSRGCGTPLAPLAALLLAPLAGRRSLQRRASSRAPSR